MLGLDPRQQQAQQQAAITAQSQHWEDELTKALREGAVGEQQHFTSPWQTAGQIAQALSGRMKAGQNAQNYAALNAPFAPGAGETPSAPVPSAPQAPPAPDLGAQPNAPQAGAAPQARHGGTPFSPEVKQAIIEGSQAVGVDPAMMAMFAHIESDGNPAAHTGKSQYKGLMQLNDREMAEMSNGQGNVFNPKDATMAAGLIAKRNQAAFEKFSGRKADPFDTYMMHQQGPAGYMQHVAQPNAPAIQNMLGTAEGRAKGPGWAREAIVENGGHANDTSAQFIGRWRQKFDRMAQGDMNAFQGGGAGQGGTTQVASLTATPGASGAPLAAPAPQGAQVAQNTQNAPGQFGMEQIPLTPEMQAGLPHRPQPRFNAQQLQQIGRMYGGNPPPGIDMDKAWQELQQYSQPLEVKVPGGTLRVPPGAKVGTYVPDIQTKTIKAAGGNEIPYQFYMNSRGEEVPIGGGMGGGPEAQLRHLGSVGNDIAAEGAGKKAQAEVGPAIEKKAGETRAEGQEKDWNAAHTGFTGMGLNFAQQAPNLKSLMKLAPQAYTGTGADTMLALNRFADKIGLSQRAAAPRELFNQLATKILGDQFAGIRNASLEEGNPASRIFKAMLDVEEKSNINAQDSLPGIMAKLKRMQNVAEKGMHWADLADEYVAKNKHLDPRFMTQLRKEIANTDYDEGVDVPAETPQYKPSSKAIELLKSKPELREKFDERYGKGAAERALGAH